VAGPPGDPPHNIPGGYSLRLGIRTDVPLVLDANIPAAAALVQLSVLGDAARIVVVRVGEAGASYFVFRRHDLASLLGRGSGERLSDRVSLDVRTPAATWDLDADEPPEGAVLLAGRQVASVVVAVTTREDEDLLAPPSRTARGVHRVRWAVRRALLRNAARPGRTRLGETLGAGDAETSRGAAVDTEVPLDAAADTEISPGAAADAATYPGAEADAFAGEPAALEPAIAGTGAGALGHPSDRRMFRQYPSLEAPREVSPGEGFRLSAGFTAQRPLKADPSVQHIFVPHAPPRLTFTVQVAGFGFDFPSGIRRELTVERDNPVGTQTFDVVADPVPVTAPRVLEVSYEYAGVVVGQAWAEVTVVPLGLPEAGRAPVAGTGVQLPGGPLTGPHLTVDIRCQVGGPEVEWVFHPRYADVPRPSYRVTTNLGEHSALSFAASVMNDLPTAKGSPLLPLKLQGNGEQIAEAMPAEFWPVLSETWARAKAAGEQPTLLVTTDEAFVPWELAWVGADRVDAGLLDGAEGGHLGCLVDVGRWVPALNPKARDPKPVSPPPDLVEVDQVAVVTGHYDTDALPWAVKEGQELAERYGGIPVAADEEEIAALLTGALIRDGTPVQPTLLHIASHGEVDPANPQYTGIVLTSGRHLDPLTLRASRMVRERGPFLFVNACQVGTAIKVLNAYSGLAGAFLAQGARGFVAPLWYVEDEPAHDLALSFYRQTLTEGRTVAAAVRSLRRTYRPGETDSPTPLAYIFYGNPLLRLARTSTPPETIPAG